MRLSYIFEAILGESITPQLFYDLKKIYAAYVDNRQPDRLAMMRSLETLDEFTKSEITRTKAAFDDAKTPDWFIETAKEILPDYERASSLLQTAIKSGRLGDAVVAIDNTLSVIHVWGSMLDNLLIAAGAKYKEVEQAMDDMLKFISQVKGYEPGMSRLEWLELLHTDQEKLIKLIKAKRQNNRLKTQEFLVRAKGESNV